MTLRDLLNPWAALREARDRANRYRVMLEAREIKIAKLSDQLKQAHFRNPATGRIGKRGVVFE